MASYGCSKCLNSDGKDRSGHAFVLISEGGVVQMASISGLPGCESCKPPHEQVIDRCGINASDVVLGGSVDSKFERVKWSSGTCNLGTWTKATVNFVLKQHGRGAGDTSQRDANSDGSIPPEVNEEILMLIRMKVENGNGQETSLHSLQHAKPCWAAKIGNWKRLMCVGNFVVEGARGAKLADMAGHSVGGATVSVGANYAWTWGTTAATSAASKQIGLAGTKTAERIAVKAAANAAANTAMHEAVAATLGPAGWAALGGDLAGQGMMHLGHKILDPDNLIPEEERTKARAKVGFVGSVVASTGTGAILGGPVGAGVGLAVGVGSWAFGQLGGAIAEKTVEAVHGSRKEYLE